MSREFDPRDYSSRERDNGIRDREDDWLTLGRGSVAPELRDDAADSNTREREDHGRDALVREPRERDGERGGRDPRDVFMRDLDLPRAPDIAQLIYVSLTRAKTGAVPIR